MLRFRKHGHVYDEGAQQVDDLLELQECRISDIGQVQSQCPGNVATDVHLQVFFLDAPMQPL